MGSLPTPPAVIALDVLYSNDPGTIAATGKALVSSLKEYGFGKLFDPSPPGENYCDILPLAKTFFDLKDSDKLAAAHPATPSPHRGYSYVGQEQLSGVTGFLDGHVNGRKLLDLKETFDMGRRVDHGSPNQWPPDSSLPGFRSSMEELFESLHGVLAKVLRAIEVELGLPPDTLVDKHNASHHELRLLHYPPTDRAALGTTHTRIADHTDFGTVTFLIQDQTGGLEARSRFSKDHYFGLKSSYGEILVILGDCFQRWTGDQLWAIPHRVTAPEAGTGQQGDIECGSRYSMAFFGKPNRDAGVGNLDGEQFQGTTYEAVTAQVYNNSKLNKTYLS